MAVTHNLNENSMNTFNLRTLIIAFTLMISSTVNAEKSKVTPYEQLTSAMGYPYKLLINRTDIIKIIYSESDDNISCKVIISWNEQELQTSLTHITKEQFNKKPLANCLPRKEAKVILARTFD